MPLSLPLQLADDEGIAAVLPVGLEVWLNVALALRVPVDVDDGLSVPVPLEVLLPLPAPLVVSVLVPLTFPLLLVDDEAVTEMLHVGLEV